MGFFGKILNVLGFYSDDDLKKLAEKKQANTQQKIKEHTVCNQPQTITQKQNAINLFTPSTQKEVVEIVNMLKSGASVRVDLKMFSGEDLIRAIDFLQGACYTLNIQPIFETGTTILLKH